MSILIERSFNESTFQNLLLRAREVQQQAYAPYSSFPVGAAIIADNNEIFAGSNVENSSYGLTICAERNALTSMIASDRNNIPLAIAIVGRPGEPCYPCGACIQVLCEFNPSMLVVLEKGETLEIRTLEEYLPFRFKLDR